MTERKEEPCDWCRKHLIANHYCRGCLGYGCEECVEDHECIEDKGTKECFMFNVPSPNA